MGSLLEFPIVKHHGRASDSAGKRFPAASRVKRSALTPDFLATSAARIASHHSDGIRERCAHLRTAAGLAPMSEAMASADGQSPMMSRNEANDVDFKAMDASIGQSVLKGKAKVSYDCGKPVGLNVPMADRMSETEEKLAFIRRVRAAREARFDTQKPMLTILGLEQGTYKQYETRTPLPHRFLPKFCAATGVSLEWLLTGEGQGPAVVEYPRQKTRISKARRGKAA